MSSDQSHSRSSSCSDLIDLSDDVSMNSGTSSSDYAGSASSRLGSEMSPFDRMFMEVEDRMHKLFERYAQIKSKQPIRSSKISTQYKQSDVALNPTRAKDDVVVWPKRETNPVRRDISDMNNDGGHTHRSYDSISSYSSFPSVQPLNEFLGPSETAAPGAREGPEKTSLGNPADGRNGYGVPSIVVPEDKNDRWCSRANGPGGFNSVRIGYSSVDLSDDKLSSSVIQKHVAPSLRTDHSSEAPRVPSQGPGDVGSEGASNPRRSAFDTSRIDNWDNNQSNERLNTSDTPRDTAETDCAVSDYEIKELPSERFGHDGTGETSCTPDSQSAFLIASPTVSLQSALQCRKPTFLRRSRERQEHIMRKKSARGFREPLDGCEAPEEIQATTVDEIVSQYKNLAKMTMTSGSRQTPKDWPDHCKPLWARQNCISLKTAKEETQRRLNAVQPPAKSLRNMQEELHSRRRRLQAYAKAVRNRNHYLYSRKRCDCGRIAPVSQ